MDETDTTYREVVECQQDLIVKFGPDGRLIFVNAAYCDIIGKSKEELAGSVFMPVTSERYSDVLATQMTKLFRSPYACTVEQWLPAKKGMRCISWSAKSIRDDKNTVISIVATGRDVTRLKQEQRILSKRDEDLMLVVESGKQMYYSHTPDQVMMYVSPRIRALLGCRPHAGKKMWTDYLTDNPLNAKGLERTIRAVASGKREPPYRIEMTGKDGSPVWFEVNEIPVVRHGKTVAIAGFLVDVTEKMQVDAGVLEAELLFKGTAAQQFPEETGSSPLKAIRTIFSKDE
jgi:PAS domain S-box-containing protein